MAESQPCSQIQLTISARNLRDKDILSKSDPMCVVSIRETSTQPFCEIARTECIMNCLNPEFAKKIQVKYKFERLQTMRFEMYDVDSDSRDLENHDFLGRLEVPLAEIVAAPDSILTRPLSGLEGNCGSITVIAEEVNGTSDILHLTCRGESLDRKGCWIFSSCNAFLELFRLNPDGTFQLAHRTEVIKTRRHSDPIWAPFRIPLRQLVWNGDPDTPFLIRCFTTSWDDGHRLIGDCKTTANNLVHRSQKIPLINPKKQRKSKYQNSGFLLFNSCHLRTQYTFFDYISTGTQLHFAVAIDFTSSNGMPSDPDSLHNITSGHTNQYQMALQSVGRILEYYNKSRQFMSFGFGAKVPIYNYNVVDDFPLTLIPDNPYCQSVTEILSAYAQAIRAVHLYGPTNFSPVINRVAEHAAQYQDGKNYFVLLIVTDGIITDLEATKKAMVNASSLPMSIIIVGVGDADFSAMDVLDSDDVKLRAGDQYAERDIVQFVPFEQVRRCRGGITAMEWEERLAEQVMEEVPYQLAEWMNARGKKPGNATENQPGPATIPAPEAPPMASAPPSPSHPSLKVM